MSLVDAHCHLHMDDYKGDRGEVIQRAKEEGVVHMVTVGIDLSDSKGALALTQKEKGILCAVGVHPHAARRMGNDDLRVLEEMARHPAVVAIGEVGLDYYRDLSPRETQREVLIGQIGLAKSVGKPLVIHCRDAYRDLVRILRAQGAQEVGGMIHCFSGGWNAARAFLDMGFYLSFAGPLTYPKSRELREVFKKIPNHRILMETDAPFLSPQPVRGRRNEPAFVVYTYQEGARLKGLELEEWCLVVEENFYKAFRISSWGIV